MSLSPNRVHEFGAADLGVAQVPDACICGETVSYMKAKMREKKNKAKDHKKGESHHDENEGYGQLCSGLRRGY